MLAGKEVTEISEMNLEGINREKLTDICGIQMDPDLTGEEKMLCYLEQIHNPYRLLCGDVVVNVRFASFGNSLEEKLKSYYGSLHGV